MHGATGAGGSERASALIVVHEGVTYEAQPGTELTFGRGQLATVRIGVRDPTMHRRAGSFRWAGGLWLVNNDGSRAALDVVLEGGLEARILPGADPLILPPGAHGAVHVMTPDAVTLAFATAPTARAPVELDEDERDDPRDVSTDGLRYRLGLSQSEARMLVALCEPRLRNPRLKDYEVPSTSALCARLSMTPKRVEDLIDGLSLKLSRHVPGLIGSNSGRAVTRRHRIAAFALDTRCVAVSDLRLLDDVPEAR